uniref:phage major tail tube protein n=1 Tax=Bilophila wadsworthia TaxID=35833 RepID=UPI003FF0CEC7
MKNRPEQTIAYRVYYGGTDMLGIASVEMPQVQYITETISGSGVAGEYESPAKGMTQSMTAKLSFISQTTDFYKLFEPGEQNLLELYASVQQADTATSVRKEIPLKITIVGNLKEGPLGSLETGKKHGNEATLECLRVEIELDGEEVLLIDKPNFIHRVRGNDSLSAVRGHRGI